MTTPLSSQAAAALDFFRRNPDTRINHSALMRTGLSRRRSQAIIKELIEAGILRVIKLVGGGTNVKLVSSDTTRVVSSDSTTVVSSGIAIEAVTLVSSNSVSYTAVTTDKATNKFFDEVEVEKENMGYEFFGSTSSGDDDLVRERQKHDAWKKAEYAQAREKKAELRRDKHRANLDPMAWTCKDVAYEFADRLMDRWDIKPFSVTQSRFVQALSGFRKQHDTNGALELQLIELFFSSLEQGKYEDGNHLWRAFLYKAPQLLQTAREKVVSTEERETAIIRDQELAERKLSLLDEEDDVQD